MVLENLDRTQWSFAEALAHVETVVMAHRAVEASRLPCRPPREPAPWERPEDPQVTWKAEAREQLMVALRDGDLHAQGRYSEERPHAWGRRRNQVRPPFRAITPASARSSGGRQDISTAS